MLARSLVGLLFLLLIVATASGQGRVDRYGDPLPDGAEARLGTVRLRHADQTRAIAFSPDGKILASASRDKVIRLWHPKTGRELKRLAGHTGYIESLAFSPDSKLLASAAYEEGDNTVRLWHINTGKELHRFAGAEHGFSSVAFSPGGNLLAAGGYDGLVWLWDVKLGNQHAKWKGHKNPVSCVQFGGDLLASSDGGKGGTLRLWEVPTGKVMDTIATINGIKSLSFSSDAKTLALAGGSVGIWDVASRKELRTIQAPDYSRISQVAFAADGKTLAVGALDGAGVWDASTGKQMLQLSKRILRDIVLAISPDGRVLATAGCMQAIHLWDTTTGKEILPGDGHQGKICSLAFAPDGKAVLSAGSWDGSVRLWDLSCGRVRRRWDHHYIVNAVAYAPDGKSLAFAEHDGTIHLGGPAERDKESVLEDGKLEANSLSFSPDSKFLASSWTLWEVSSGRRVRHFEGGTTQVTFANGGRIVARYSDRDGSVSLTDAKTGKELPPFSDIEFQAAAFEPNGTRAATISNTHDQLQIWEPTSGRELVSSEIEMSRWRIAWSEDGKTLAGGNDRGEVVLWETATCKERCTFRGQQGTVSALVFSKDGNKLASGGQDSTILIWNIGGRSSAQPVMRADLSDQDFQRNWQAVASDDSKKAFEAMLCLTAHPEQSVAFIAKHLEVVPDKVPEEITRLVEDLSSDQFPVRDKAKRSLEHLGEKAAPALARALNCKATLESQRRVQLVLARLDAPSNERLRTLRALEVLERIGEPAKQHLQSLSNGAPESVVTQQARQILKRIGG